MPPSSPIPFVPRSKADALALEIAQAFGDEARLPFYREVCSAHEPGNVYRAFREAMAVPIADIKKSRRALFIYLVHEYDREA